MPIAALFVDARGCYSGLPDVDVWDVSRDARLYPGPHPVVAHPPCARWCRLAGMVEYRWGHKKHEDGGCFESALRSVQTWGGVLEHPAYTDAWALHDIPPPLKAGWIRCNDGGWTCHVEQGHYGHQGSKPTWLYACGVELPSLHWGNSGRGPRGVHSLRRASRVHDAMSKRQRSATPVEFRDVLLSMARSVRSAA